MHEALKNYFARVSLLRVLGVALMVGAALYWLSTNMNCQNDVLSECSFVWRGFTFHGVEAIVLFVCYLTAIALFSVAFLAKPNEEGLATYEFISSWTDGTTPSTRTFWYCGETDDVIWIIEKRPGKWLTYHVNPSAVELLGIEPFVFGTTSTQIKLNPVNIRVLTT